ncbi:hypothetical protein [Paraburkholderia sp. J67]|nr:hypothetical protein [Paraburkholderia sp. J67]
MNECDLKPFTPVTNGPLELAHRVVLAPMTRLRSAPGQRNA